MLFGKEGYGYGGDVPSAQKVLFACKQKCFHKERSALPIGLNTSASQKSRQQLLSCKSVAILRTTCCDRLRKHWSTGSAHSESHSCVSSSRSTAVTRLFEIILATGLLLPLETRSHVDPFCLIAFKELNESGETEIDC